MGRESWRRIREGIAAKIDSGTLLLGPQLPTETALYARFKSGPPSPRRSVQSLAFEGKLRARASCGRGQVAGEAALADARHWLAAFGVKRDLWRA